MKKLICLWVCISSIFPLLFSNAAESSSISLPAGSPSELLLKYVQLGETTYVMEVIKRNPALDVNRPKAPGNKTVIYLACENGYTDIVKLLLQRNADVCICDTEKDKKYSALTIAAKNGHLGVIKEILKTGIDKESRDVRNRTILYTAAVNNQPKLVEWLCNHKAKINFRRNGWSPLAVAADNGYTEVVEILCKAGANVNTATSISYTPLMYAAENGYTEIVQILIKYKANLEYSNDFGSTALLKAIEKDYVEIVDLLCRAGADVNHCSVKSFPLQEAAYRKNTKIVKILLKHGADPYRRAILTDHSIITEARRKSSPEIVNLLQNYRK